MLHSELSCLLSEICPTPLISGKMGRYFSMVKARMTAIELLSPAKDLECGMAAINCGADAVYLGAAQFGARENAGNSLDGYRSAGTTCASILGEGLCYAQHAAAR